MNAIEIVMHRSLSHDRAAVRSSGRVPSSASLAKMAVSELGHHFDSTFQAEVTEFSPMTTDSYVLKARIAAPGFAGLLRDDLPEAAETYEKRFGAAKGPFGFSNIEIDAIVLDGNRHQWLDLLDVRRDQWVSSGKFVLSLSAAEVLDATVKQVGDFAILEDRNESCFAVAKIDENGMAQPIQGGLDGMNDAEEILREKVGSSSTMSIKF